MACLDFFLLLALTTSVFSRAAVFPFCTADLNLLIALHETFTTSDSDQAQTETSTSVGEKHQCVKKKNHTLKRTADSKQWLKRYSKGRDLS